MNLTEKDYLSVWVKYISRDLLRAIGGVFFSVNSGRLVAYRHTKDTISRYEMIFFIRYMGKKDHSADKVAGEAMGIW